VRTTTRWARKVHGEVAPLHPSGRLKLRNSVGLVIQGYHRCTSLVLSAGHHVTAAEAQDSNSTFVDNTIDVVGRLALSPQCTTCFCSVSSQMQT
jgi:hypothetical protein